jgi:hypothetical protein
MQGRSGRQDELALSVEQTDADEIADGSLDCITLGELAAGGNLSFDLAER